MYSLLPLQDAQAYILLLPSPLYHPSRNKYVSAPVSLLRISGAYREGISHRQQLFHNRHAAAATELNSNIRLISVSSPHVKQKSTILFS